jgi:hypothetical protein
VGWSGRCRLRWRLPLAVHDPAKIVADLAIAVTLGGDCAADVAVVGSAGGVRAGGVGSGGVAVDRLADDAGRALAAIRAARAAARA